ncbi:PQ loop repeat protein [compost metagenome]
MINSASQSYDSLNISYYTTSTISYKINGKIMDYIQLLGLGAAVFTTGANFPQAIKVIKTKSTKSLSAWSFSMLFIGSVTWVIYGFLRDDIPVIVANGISGCLHGIILSIKLKYGKK